MRATIIEWDGTNVPNELQHLPPGRYVLDSVENIEDLNDLTEEEDAGIQLAIDQIDAGQGIPAEEVMRAIKSRALQR